MSEQPEESSEATEVPTQRFFAFALTVGVPEDQLMQIAELVSRIQAGVALEGLRVQVTMEPVEVIDLEGLASHFGHLLEEDDDESD